MNIKYPLYFLLLFFFSSCFKDVDFDQVKDFEATPQYTFSLVNFTYENVDFVDDRLNEIPELRNSSSLILLDKPVIQESLQKVVVKMEFANEFSRTFTIDVNFTDNNNIITHSLNSINVPQKEPRFIYTDTVNISTNPSFLNSRVVNTTLRLNPSSSGVTINPVNKSKFKLKSALDIYLKVKP